jgi:DNA-binding IclR family transcriptional regulator
MPRKQKSALDKALMVLDVVLDYPQPIALAELAKRLGGNKGTVHRWSRQLEREGLLSPDARGRFSAGPRLSALALATLRSRNQGAAVRALLDQVVAELKESCSIGILDGFDYVVVELSDCPQSLRTHMHVGSRAQAHCLSGGKVLLANLPVAALDRLLATNKLLRRARRTITSRATLESELAAVRVLDFALNNQESLDDVVAVAVPIRDGKRRVVAALSLHGPTLRLSLAQCRAHVPHLRRAATRIAKIWLS